MPFQPGNKLATGHAPHGLGVKEIIRSQPLEKKKKLVATAYRLAMAGNVAWAEWLMKHAGEGFYASQQASEAAAGTTIREIIIRETRHDSTSQSVENGANTPLDAHASDDSSVIDCAASLLPSTSDTSDITE